MSEAPKSGVSSSDGGETEPAEDSPVCEADRRFLLALREFIEHEKESLNCPEEGPHELRYVVYRSVFNKLIGRATASKRLLMSIKAEYDGAVRELRRRQDEGRAASGVMCPEWANQQADRTAAPPAPAAGLQEGPRGPESQTWTPGSPDPVPGLAGSEDPAPEDLAPEDPAPKDSAPKDSAPEDPAPDDPAPEDPASLDRVLARLEGRRAALVLRKQQLGPVKVQTEPDARLQAARSHAENLGAQNQNLKLL